MNVELLPPNSPRWAAILDTCAHDFYHFPSYARLCGSMDEAEPVAVLITEGQRRFLLPLLLRPIRGRTERDATSPYGYPGPIVLGPASEDPDFLRSCVAAMSEELAHNGIVSAFVRLHPLLNKDPVDLLDLGHTETHGETVFIDLTETATELWQQVMSGHRNQINRARRLGYEVIHDTHWHHLDDFVRIYSENMRRVQASSYYYFSSQYFNDLRVALGEHLHLFVMIAGGIVAGASLFTEVDGLVQYHLSGTDQRYLRDGPAKAILNHVRDWAKLRGNLQMHLGGGVGATGDSLFAFKAGFSRHRSTFRTWRIVTDKQRYGDLMKAKGFDISDRSLSGFFPAYRQGT